MLRMVPLPRFDGGGFALWNTTKETNVHAKKRRAKRADRGTLHNLPKENIFHAKKRSEAC